jgi:hypothetical protein
LQVPIFLVVDAKGMSGSIKNTCQWSPDAIKDLKNQDRP